MELKQINGIWMPAYEKMFGKFAEAGSYQKHIYKAALAQVWEFGAAIDIGANIGFWSIQMAKHFQQVFAFEPIEENFQCLNMNVPSHVRPIQSALGSEAGEVALSNLGSSLCGGFGRYLGRKDTQTVSLATLDSFELWEHPIGFIKIDVQGMETDVLLGGEKTFRTCKPVVVVEVEQNGKVDPRPLKVLRSWGAKVVKGINADRIVVWKPKMPKIFRRPRIYPLPALKDDHWFKTKKGWSGGKRTSLEQLIGLDPLLDQISGKTVLDVGCAEGLIGLELAKRGAALVHGVDFNMEYITAANRLCKKGYPLRFWHLDVERSIRTVPKLQRHYDVILLLAVLHKLKHPEMLLRFVVERAPEWVAVKLPTSIFRGKRSKFREIDPVKLLAPAYILSHNTIGINNEWIGLFRLAEKEVLCKEGTGKDLSTPLVSGKGLGVGQTPPSGTELF